MTTFFIGETFDAIVAKSPPVSALDSNRAEASDGEVAAITTKTIIQNPDGTQIVTEETTYPGGRTTKTMTTIDEESVTTPLLRRRNEGAWRYGLFSCFDVFCNGMFWISWCCTYITMGQLLQRMKMNVCGQPGEYKNTCVIWTIIMAIMVIIYCVDGAMAKNTILDAIFGIIYITVFLTMVFAMTNVRYYMRKKWRIPADCCDGNGCLSDCCCVYWCGCCSLIQMMRHTHDEKKYHYNCGSATGLYDDEGGPEVV